jgi:Mg-chelatase subunit ChlD
MNLRNTSLLIAALLCLSAVADGQSVEPKKEVSAAGKAYVGFVIDCSGSQRLALDRVIGAVKQITEGLDDTDESFLVRFVDAGRISVVQELTSSRADVDDAAEGLYVDGGLTAVVDGVDAAGRYLSRNMPDDSSAGVLILISDGDDRGSGRKPDEVIGALSQKKIRVFTIGISDLKVSNKLLDRFAKETGGKSYTPRNTTELSNAVVDILRSLNRGNASK